MWAHCSTSLGIWLHRAWKKLRCWMPHLPRSLPARLVFWNPRSWWPEDGARKRNFLPRCQEILKRCIKPIKLPLKKKNWFFYSQISFHFVVVFNGVNPNNLSNNLTCHLWLMWLLGSLKNSAYTTDVIVSVSYYCSVLIRAGATHKQPEVNKQAQKHSLTPYIMM